MSNWIITPDKYLTEEESKQLRKTCHNIALLAKLKVIQFPNATLKVAVILKAD